jgi:hypothetical protein
LSQQNSYQSCRGGGNITAAQFVMEHLLLLLAKQKRTTLPEKFWQLDEYKKLWKRHVRSVHARLKEYDAVVITKALQDRKLSRLASLSNNASWLWKPTFDKYQRQFDIQQELKQENISTNCDPTKRRPNINSQTKNLRDLDNA